MSVINAMPLTFNLQHLERKNLHLVGELPAVDLDADGMDELIGVRHPLQYDLWIERLGNNVLSHGTLSLTIDCECARCLKSFPMTLKLDSWSVNLPLEGEDKVAVANDSVDLTPLIREDILLAFPQHPLCKSECGGLPREAQQADTNGNRDTGNGDESSPWAELNKLKF